MKRIFFFLLLSVATFFITNISAASNPAWDYTYINCNTGSDVTGTPFDSDKPYLSLKKWVESTIAYINSNWLSSNTGSGLAYSWATFNIYVQAGCIYNDILWNKIDINFTSNNHSQVKIIGHWGKFGIDNIYFYLPSKWNGNIIFENIVFLRNNLRNFYFDVYKDGWYSHNIYNWFPIIIKNAIININNGTQFMFYRDNYISSSYWYYNNRPGWFYIFNSSINLEISTNTTFRIPVFLKNNKIKIKNINPNENKYDVFFAIAGNNTNWYNYGSINLVSNEIDMSGNHFKTANNHVNFINNLFINTWNFLAGSDTTSSKINHFINNTIHSISEINFSNNHYAFNNYIPNWIIDTNNFNNIKRNFSTLTGNEKWIGWILHKELWWNVKIQEDYISIYKEVTWENLIPTENPSIYTIN